MAKNGNEVSGPANAPNTTKIKSKAGAYANPANNEPDGKDNRYADNFGGVGLDLSAGAPKAAPTKEGGIGAVSIKGGVWDGTAVDDPAQTDYGNTPGGRTGKPVRLTLDRGGVEPGGSSESDAALGAIGAKVGKGVEISSVLNGSKRDRGEKIEIPSESNINSANARVKF